MPLLGRTNMDSDLPDHWLDLRPQQTTGRRYRPVFSHRTRTRYRLAVNLKTSRRREAVNRRTSNLDREVINLDRNEEEVSVSSKFRA